VGLGAPTDFVDFLTQLAGVHDAKLRLDEARYGVIMLLNRSARSRQTLIVNPRQCC